MQETEIPPGFPDNIPNCGNYVLELETNDLKKRAGFYIRLDVKYTRRKDLEKENLHFVIIDLHLDVECWVINFI